MNAHVARSIGAAPTLVSAVFGIGDNAEVGEVVVTSVAVNVVDLVCGPLAVMKSPNDTMRFIHFTVNSYLLVAMPSGLTHRFPACVFRIPSGMRACSFEIG
jgi:hypothetical protein